MNRRTPRPGPPKRPQAPADLRLAEGVQLDLADEQTVKQVAYDESDLSGVRAEGVEFLQCRFRKARLAGSELDRLRMADCLVETSDLSNLRAKRSAMERVRVTGARLTGLAWNDGVVIDATFTDCKIDLANWRFTRFAAVTFETCNLSRADFGQADLRGATFVDCDLSGAQFDQARMAGCRFRHCELDGVGGITSWAGAIVHPDDLPALSRALAGALGIAISAE
ncbi:pentapeptide repeat-containing protein [Actinoplanes sp. NPDC051470]|uniref:pentapeptide repeat-containing protein n=1 Tax=unclassified Actinoplanes TaxID=2626549 RepID=UPI00343B7F13